MTDRVTRAMLEYAEKYRIPGVRELIAENEQLNTKVSQANARILELETAARRVFDAADNGIGFTGETPCPISDEVGKCVACDYRPLCEVLAHTEPWANMGRPKA